MLGPVHPASKGNLLGAANKMCRVVHGASHTHNAGRTRDLAAKRQSDVMFHTVLAQDLRRYTRIHFYTSA